MVKDIKNTKTKQGVDAPKEIKKGKKLSSKTIAKKPRMANRFNKLRIKKGESTGIIYIGHLPKGFTEEELKGFFK
jgi:hypothetical protein